MQLIPLKKKFMLEERVHPWSDFKAGLLFQKIACVECDAATNDFIPYLWR